MEKQLTIDDYLNNGDVAMIGTEPEQTTTTSLEPVDYESLTKGELINILKSKDQALKNYEAQVKRDKEIHDTEIKNLNTYYGARLKEQANLVSYYERKFKLLQDLITIEQGGEK